MAEVLIGTVSNPPSSIMTAPSNSPHVFTMSDGALIAIVGKYNVGIRYVRAKSTDNGATWGAFTEFGVQDNTNWYISCAQNGDTIWTAAGSGGTTIYVTKSVYAAGAFTDTSNTFYGSDNWYFTQPCPTRFDVATNTFIIAAHRSTNPGDLGAAAFAVDSSVGRVGTGNMSNSLAGQSAAGSFVGDIIYVGGVAYWFYQLNSASAGAPAPQYYVRSAAYDGTGWPNAAGPGVAPGITTQYDSNQAPVITNFTMALDGSNNIYVAWVEGTTLYFDTVSMAARVTVASSASGVCRMFRLPGAGSTDFNLIYTNAGVVTWAKRRGGAWTTKSIPGYTNGTSGVTANIIGTKAYLISQGAATDPTSIYFNTFDMFEVGPQILMSD